MEPLLVVYGDFNCPFCYALNEHLITLGLERKVQWRSIEHEPEADLHRMDPSIKDELEEELLRVRTKAPGLVITLPGGRVNTGTANRAIAAAYLSDPARAVVLRGLIYRAYWIEGKDISSPDVLQELVLLSGLSSRVEDKAVNHLLAQWQQAWEQGPFQLRIPSLQWLPDQTTFLGLPLPSQFKTFFDQHALADNQSTLVCERQSVANILIADDDINYAHKLQAQLKDAFDVRVVHTSARVVSLCQEAEPPDLVLVSVSLGEGDGFELCRHLKSQEKTTRLPIFLLAEDYSEEAEVKGLQYGAADFLRKGGSPVILQARMKTHLQLRRMTEILEVRANYDSLTGLHNRREFEHVLENEWRRACRVQAPLTLLFIDVDHFKAYNDHYGHLAGDECLRRLGEVLGRCLSRSGEFVARYGGEEFVALLPGVEGRAVERSVENIQRMVEKLEIEHQASPDYRQLSLSIGAVTQVPQLNVSPQQLLAEADQRLYQAKSEGRNRLIYTERP